MTPRYYTKRDLKPPFDTRKGSHMEYHEEALALIDSYLEKYKYDIGALVHAEWSIQNMIRFWLYAKSHWKKLGGIVSKEIDEYAIKSIIGIIPEDPIYEKIVQEIEFPKPGINLVPHEDFHIHKEPKEMQ